MHIIRSGLMCVVVVSLMASLASRAYSQFERFAMTVMDPAEQREFPSDDPDAFEIWTYTDEMSYAPGEEVVFYVYSTAPTYSMVIERDGALTETVFEKTGLKGKRQKTAEGCFRDGCQWKESYRFKIPPDWKSGVYVVTLEIEDDRQRKEVAEHFFVVRSSKPGESSKIAYVLATSTYIAYNDWGGANAYRTKNEPVGQPILTTQRPWAKGFVRLPEEAPRYGQGPKLKPFANPRYPIFEWSLTNGYSRLYSAAGWAYYDGPFAKWLEREGFAIEYLTQHDLHFRPEIIKNYDLLIVTGHDEYWSWKMRDAVDSFMDSGGNYARFGANYIFQVRIEDDGDSQVCYKHAESDPKFGTDEKHLTTTIWEHPVVNRPGAASFGLTGIAGIYALHGGATPRAPGGYTVYRPEHWVFDGTDLYFGDMFGERPTAIVAFEVDGLDFTFRNGLPEPTYRDGALKSTEILALVPAIKGEEDHSGGTRLIDAPLEEFAMGAEGLETYFGEIEDEELTSFKTGEGILSDYGNAAMVVMSHGEGKGTVFNAGTATWVHGLIDKDFYTEQITRNVVNRLSRGPAD